MNVFGNNNNNLLTGFVKKYLRHFSTSFYNLLFFMSLCEKGTFSMTFRLTLRFLLQEDNAVKRID